MGIKVAEWNNGRGEIQIHRPGCADLKRNRRGAPEVFEYETESYKEIVLGVYPPDDFDYDADTEWRDFAGDVHVMPCCPDMPDEPAETVVEAPTTAHGTRIDHRGHGHELTPAARAACRKFMAAHDGMDEVTFRVAQREAELDDAFGDE